jgi:hypothetical protein
MHRYTDRTNRNRHSHTAMPLSRATVQMWGLEQLKDSSPPRRPRRKPLRAIAQRVAVILGR